jgi:hypothetical protein
VFVEVVVVVVVMLMGEVIVGVDDVGGEGAFDVGEGRVDVGEGKVDVGVGEIDIGDVVDVDVGGMVLLAFTAVRTGAGSPLS